MLLRYLGGLVLLASLSLLACSPSADTGAEAPGEGASAGESGPDAETLRLEVDSERVPCSGVGRQECYRVRSPGEDDWRLFYDQIRDFEFEPGFRYVLDVERTRVPNPPADASSFRYRLLEVVSRESAS